MEEGDVHRHFFVLQDLRLALEAKNVVPTGYRPWKKVQKYGQVFPSKNKYDRRRFTAQKLAGINHSLAPRPIDYE